MQVHYCYCMRVNPYKCIGSEFAIEGQSIQVYISIILFTIGSEISPVPRLLIFYLFSHLFAHADIVICAIESLVQNPAHLWPGNHCQGGHGYVLHCAQHCLWIVTMPLYNRPQRYLVWKSWRPSFCTFLLICFAILKFYFGMTHTAFSTGEVHKAAWTREQCCACNGVRGQAVWDYGHVCHGFQSSISLRYNHVCEKERLA